MKESPILFSTDMVKAILQGRKTQTRRILKIQPPENAQFIGIRIDLGNQEFGYYFNDGKTGNDQGFFPGLFTNLKCPYGQPGDLLWVRESFSIYRDAFLFKADEPHIFKGIKYKPSIHMPKEYARIWLQVTEVRVQRLQDITDEDAIAEGIEKHPNDKTNVHFRNYHHKDFLMIIPKYSFKTLWEKTTGFDSWDANPWVWVISYKVLSTTGKPSNL
jgi:hypothetical protein